MGKKMLEGIDFLNIKGGLKMLKWEDTLLVTEELKQAIPDDGRFHATERALEVQAKKTWDIAEKHFRFEFLEKGNPIFEAGKKEGMQEVVDWLKTHEVVLYTEYKEQWQEFKKSKGLK